MDGLTLDDLPGVTSEIHISCKTIGFTPRRTFTCSSLSPLLHCFWMLNPAARKTF